VSKMGFEKLKYVWWWMIDKRITLPQFIVGFGVVIVFIIIIHIVIGG
jgi:hypothetical protein